MALNYARFGNITEFGHNYLPEFTRTTTGQFNLSYLKENLMHYLRLPAAGENGGTLSFFSSDGMAFWLDVYKRQEILESGIAIDSDGFLSFSDETEIKVPEKRCV